MRDHGAANYRAAADKQEQDVPLVEYKDVVVVGNGPSGIALSYLLWGHRPFYTGAAHPDEMLTARLRALAAPDAPLLAQDLEALSRGLEGRSRNPVSVLVDALQLPAADLGAELPSLLRWRRAAAPLDHVVLGRAAPGGVWTRVDGSVLTLSLAAWMALPGAALTCPRGHRPQAASVAHYYRDYVRGMGLAPAFRDDTTVVDVRPLPGRSGRPLWRVEAETVDGARLVYAAPSVVLATGANDRPNRLGALGEAQGAASGWVFHELAAFEKALDVLDGDRAAPVLVVGAGLSAADAIIAARFRSLAILHVFRRRSDALDKQLPENMYPEYHKVQQMMGDGGGGYPRYHALPRHTVLSFSEAGGGGGRHTVTLQAPDGKVIRLRVAAAAVLIGARPDLSFLRGLDLGADPSQPVDCRSNPVAVDPYTHEARHAPQGLYALGPLVGDNFVRFILGGAVAVAAHILKDRGADDDVDVEDHHSPAAPSAATTTTTTLTSQA